MPSTQTSAEAVLRLFQDPPSGDARDARTFHTILALLAPRNKGTVSARLSELVKAGILRTEGRGTYRLVYSGTPLPPTLEPLFGVLGTQLPVGKLHGTVIWDATPYLATLEDGATAQINVVETQRPTAGATARMLLDAWPGRDVPHIQEYGDRDHLVDAVLGRTELNLRPGDPRILVGPCDGHYTATELLHAGVRTTTPERFLMDILQTRDPGTSDSAWLALMQGSVRPDRLFAVADERNLTPQLYVILAGLINSLPQKLRNGFLERVQEPARTLLETHTP